MEEGLHFFGLRQGSKSEEIRFRWRLWLSLLHVLGCRLALCKISLEPCFEYQHRWQTRYSSSSPSERQCGRTLTQCHALPLICEHRRQALALREMESVHMRSDRQRFSELSLYWWDFKSVPFGAKGWTLYNSALALVRLCGASCCLDSQLDWTEGNESETHGFQD